MLTLQNWAEAETGSCSDMLLSSSAKTDVYRNHVGRYNNTWFSYGNLEKNGTDSVTCRRRYDFRLIDNRYQRKTRTAQITRIGKRHVAFSTNDNTAYSYVGRVHLL